ncbi:hypothetical protein [Neobacillus vireti]|uniref:hypothetical protein n=1 Tax=Neobacillus vireti TaxID=220686 RepID=UPI002FFF5DD0
MEKYLIVTFHHYSPTLLWCGSAACVANGGLNCLGVAAEALPFRKVCEEIQLK